MKTTTMCILSGFFGALFAMACGVVDGVGNKVANADTEIILTKEVISVTCSEHPDSPSVTVPDEDISWLWEGARTEGWIVSSALPCFNSETGAYETGDFVIGYIR